MGREVGTKPCYLLEAYESKLASGFADSIRSKNNRPKFMLAQQLVCTCISQLLLQLCYCVWEVSRSYDSLWRLTETSIELYSLLWFITVKGCRALLGSEKTLEEKSSGNYVPASKKVLSQESHRKHLITPATSCDNTCERLPTREAQRLNTQHFYCELAMGAFSA